MAEKNQEPTQGEDLPEYLKSDADEPAEMSADAWAEAFAASAAPAAEDSTAAPDAPTTPDAPAPTPEAKPEPAQSQPEPEAKPEPQPEPQSEPEPKPESKPEPEPQPKPEPEPQPVASKSAAPDAPLTSTTGEFPAPETAAEQLTELDTTIVRRQSLLGTSRTPEEYPEENLQPQWQPRPAEPLGNDVPNSEQTLLAGASIKPAPMSRTAAHLWSLLAGVILLPLAWVSLMHSQTMLSGKIPDDALYASGYSVEGLIFLGVGLIALILAGSALSLSSLGAFVAGILVFALGTVFVAVPNMVEGIFGGFAETLIDSKLVPLRVLGRAFLESGISGQFMALGLALIMVGVIAHVARRRGRKDHLANVALERAQAAEAN